MSFVRVIRGFAEASLAVLAFAFAILLIGIPVALIVRGVHEGVGWLARIGGEMSALVEALVSVFGLAGGLVTALLVAVLVVRFSHWLGTLRVRAISGEALYTEGRRPEIRKAAS
jgi:hypothetical protein